MFKIAMLILILLLVSMNVVEEEAHEYLAFFAAAVFVCHAAAQKWWFSAVCPRFGMALRIKSLSVIALMIVFLFTMISGALLSRYALPMLRVKTIQALMIDVHHSLGMVFLLLSFFHFGVHLSIEKIKAIGIVKVGFVTLGMLVLYIALHCLPDFVYSDFEMNMVDLLRNYDSGLFLVTLVPFISVFLGLLLNTLPIWRANNV
ncbi:hypothetical protein [Turicimonas muris]|uniref:DUF4405 domain-containing protein n=2 Tax=Turicimonas muris TaxID=1796652 RepID=A0A227KQH5_9BURK|nr:hypothetical protein [Turicimonas muris]ANU64988.1 hypothetical protein A4V04_00110 [Burkholderiales bacterium YL45]OXE50790.1 hypothetical protein ADH67_00340 [Turicimonas muris]QQQ96150.1 hypothetical protein I5Q81_09270 [Turicimonas muris]